MSTWCSRSSSSLLSTKWREKDLVTWLMCIISSRWLRVYCASCSSVRMVYYKAAEPIDDPSDWVDINHPLNRISLPLYNLGLQIQDKGWCIHAFLIAGLSTLTAVICVLTVVHVPQFYWIPKLMRSVVHSFFVRWFVWVLWDISS